MVDELTRERLRKNVGHPHQGVTYHDPRYDAGRPTTIFQNGALVAISPGPGEGLPPPTVTPPGAIMGGRTIALAMSVAAGAREVVVSNALPAPSVLRQLVVNGTWSLDLPVSFRVLISEDTDTAAVANPTGSDLIEFGGEVVGGEDPGAHAHLTTANLVVEPWRRILTPGQRLKVKVHNNDAAARLIAVLADFDDLIPA